MRSFLLLLMTLLAIPATSAQHGGAWSRTTAGGVVSVGKQVLRSAAISAPPHVSHAATAVSVSWRITLLSPPPPGLEIKLCRSERCFLLPSLSGQRNISVPLSPAGEFRFIYSVASPGQLRPALNVVSNQLTVNYR